MFKRILFCMLSLISILLTPFALADAGTEDNGLEDNLTFHVFDDVDLISTLKYEYGKPKIVIKSVYPQLASDTNREGVNNFNEIALQIVKDEIAKFRSIVKNNEAIQKTLPREQITNNLYIDYNTSYIQSKKNHIISIRFSMKAMITGNNLKYHNYLVLNYNLDTNQQILLENLFLPDSNYLYVLSQYTHAVLFRHLTNKEMIMDGTAPLPENFSNWNIKSNGLVITFNENQVAPASYGTQTVIVPYSVLRKVLSPSSPIADCINNNSRCAKNNLLTGGFIDEAYNQPYSRTMQDLHLVSLPSRNEG